MFDENRHVALRILLERCMLWGTRGVGFLTFLGVAWLNYDQGNYSWFVLSGIGGVVVLFVAVMDFKVFVGRENSLVLQRSPEFQELREDVREIKELIK